MTTPSPHPGDSGRLADVPLVLIVDDNYLVREALRGLLATRDDFEIAAVCEDLDSLLGAVEAERPDVVVTDIRMPPGNTDEGIQVATRLRETSPEVGVVVLSQYATPTFVLALLEGGSERRALICSASRVIGLRVMDSPRLSVAAPGTSSRPALA